MMEKKARFREMLLTADGNRRMVFELSAGVTDTEMQSITDKDLRLTVREWRDKRSLDANAYYWVLVSKLAGLLKISKPRLHNLLLRRYGQFLTVDGQKAIVMLPDTEEAEEMALEALTFHVRPTSQVRAGNPVNFRGYVLLRGSSDYDSKEMGELLDGLIDECKQAGIDTATPEELERMKELYARNHPAR